MLSLILGLVGPPTAALGLCWYRKQSIEILTSFAGPYAAGFAVALFCVYIVPLRHCPTNPFLSRTVQRREAINKRYEVGASDIDDDYGMEQLWLNADLQPRTLWVNLGYWKSAQTASQASADLFQKVLDVSGISGQSEFSVIELGSACAETALYLMTNYAKSCTRWTGLTLSSLQANVASRRISTATQTSKLPHGPAQFESFHADASQPDSWSKKLAQRLSESHRPWMMALDAFVHFEPSRVPAITQMKKEYNASLAVTDQIRKDQLTWMEALKLRLSFHLVDTPWKNILTRSEYIKMLVDCGYDESKIQIVPISEHVYEPYHNFVTEQGRRWQDLGGGSWDYADFWLVASVVKFWATSGLVDSCIIVARA